ncbi:hypothetical protein ACMGDK_11670 [Chryseobacterium sp. DT-3]|uniref:hypothetical protein n=1 Tax=Chryseobacterium sp. DT-3 TaxID=3396164 RepID=UPI003F1BAD66
MTKEQKIQEAWGENFEIFKDVITENGWADFKKHYGDRGLMLSFKDTPLEVMDNYDPKYCYWKRPIALSGIENNNGWIKIESEEDLPEESSNYWIMQSDNRIQTMKEYDDNKKYYNIIATHYQPIEKPKPPIY